MAKPLNSDRIGRASAKAGVINCLRTPMKRADLEKAFVATYPNLRLRFSAALRSLRRYRQVRTNRQGFIEKREPEEQG